MLDIEEIVGKSDRTLQVKLPEHLSIKLKEIARRYKTNQSAVIRAFITKGFEAIESE